MQNVGNYAEYNRIVVNTIDIDILILLISFISCSDEIDQKLEIFAYLINGKKYYNMRYFQQPWKRCVPCFTILLLLNWM